MDSEPFCAIPQKVLVGMIRQRFSEGEHAVLLALLYRLHRFAKDGGAPQAIGFSGFAKLTGLQRRSVIRCLNSLINRRVISVRRVSGGDPNDRNIYGVNPPDWWVDRHYSGGDRAVTGSSDGAVTTPGDSGATPASDRRTTPYNQGTNGNQRGSSGLRPSERPGRADDDKEDGHQASLQAMHAVKAGLVEAGIIDGQETEQVIASDVDGQGDAPDFDDAPPPGESDRPEDDEAIEAIEAELLGVAS